MVTYIFAAEFLLAEKPFVVEFPKVCLAIFYRDDIIFEEGNFEVLLVDLNHEGVSDVLDSEILADGLQLRDEQIIRDRSFLVAIDEVS